MAKIIRFLNENMYILELLKNGQASLIGVSEVEKKAILDAFDEKLHPSKFLWGGD